MTVIARWECPEHGDKLAGSQRTGGAEIKRYCVECHAYIKPVKVEYVPASQLQGAVDLLRELWADESVRAAVGEGNDATFGLYRRVEAALNDAGGR